MGSPQVNVFGWYNKQNVGDESYKLAFPMLFPSANFYFTDVPLKGYRSDITILGGGDVVNADSLALLRAARGRRFIMSATIPKNLPHEAFEGIELILVRDENSHRRCLDANLPSRLCPDFATALVPNRDRGHSFIKKQFAKAGNDLYQNIVTVVLNGHLCCRETDRRRYCDFEKLCFDLADVADNTAASFIFIPFGCSFPWDDRVANSWAAIKAKWWKKNAVVYNPITVQTALDIISASDAAVSTRLHSSIFSIACGTPFIDITHNHKNTGLLDSIGRSEWGMPLNSFDWKLCHERLSRMISDPQAHREIEIVREKQLLDLKRVISNVRLG